MRTTPPRPAATASTRVTPGIDRTRQGGLTLPGASLVAVAGTVVGALVDLASTGSLGVPFAVLFTLSCLAAALAVRRAEVARFLVVPPLAYCAGALITAGMNTVGGDGPLVTREVAAVVNAVVLNAPGLWIGFLATAAVVAARRRR